MPQDALHVRRLAEELRHNFVGGKINRIVQADKEELTFYIYTEKQVAKLVFSTNASFARVCPTDDPRPPLPAPPNFCMLLRKHLLGAEILDVRQVGFERIIEMDFFCQADFFAGKRTLVCELMGKYSNLILTEEGKILGALKTTSLEEGRRVLFSGAQYTYPPAQEKLSPFDRERTKALFDGYFANGRGMDREDLARLIFENVVGLAPSTARQIALSYDGNVSPEEHLFAFCSQTDGVPCVTFDGETPTEFFAFPVENGRAQPTLMAAEELFYGYKQRKKTLDGKRRKVEGLLKAYEKKTRKHLQEITEKLLEADGAEAYRKKGELLTANLYRIPHGAEEIEVDDWWDGGKMKITLDVSMPPAKNAQKYFKLYTKHKRAKEMLAPRLKEMQDTLAYLDSVYFALSIAETQEDLDELEKEALALFGAKEQTARKGKQKDEPSKYRLFEIDGFRIAVGKNNLQNERLLKEASAKDIWLHAQKYHSAHVILFAGGKSPSDRVLQGAAEICAYYSQARGGEKIPVDYCERKQVKKPPASKAGFVHYTGQQTMLVRPDPHREDGVEG